MQKSISCPNCGSPVSEISESGDRICAHCATRYSDKQPEKKILVVPAASASEKTRRLAALLVLVSFGVVAACAVWLALVVQNAPARREMMMSALPEPVDEAALSTERQLLIQDDTPGAAKKAAASVTTLVPLYDSIGSVYFAGLIRNTGEAALEFPKVTVTLFDATGKAVGDGYGYCTREQLLPGEESIVRVLIMNVPQFDRFEQGADVRPLSKYSTINRGEIELSQTKMNFSGGGRLDVSGTVTNHDSRICSSIKIESLIYKEGVIAGTGLSVISDELQPGQSIGFSMYITSEIESADSMKFDYQAHFE